MTPGEDGDTFRRRWDGDVAQCGCEWTRDQRYGDVLVECPIHHEAAKALLAKFEREDDVYVPEEFVDAMIDRFKHPPTPWYWRLIPIRWRPECYRPHTIRGEIV